MRAKSGFTLVEILIVVVILGILAAIVIPQFTGASTEAKESALVSDLQSVRSQVELYKIQHNDILPGEILNADGTITAATAVSFVTAFTSKTDQYGNVDPGAGDPAVFRFGPYMRQIPDNPFSNSEAVTVLGISEGRSSVSVSDTKLAAGDNTAGWHFVNAATGLDRGHFQAADPLANPLDDTDLHVDY
ncbi:MAG: type II secretion system protein [Planctomycetota bacterium]|nr:MAG: type II secretion system protein [Planctomycetota bacterium]